MPAKPLSKKRKREQLPAENTTHTLQVLDKEPRQTHTSSNTDYQMTNDNGQVAKATHTRHGRASSASGWQVSQPRGGRFIDAEPVFSKDDRQVIQYCIQPSTTLILIRETADISYSLIRPPFTSMLSPLRLSYVPCLSNPSQRKAPLPVTPWPTPLQSTSMLAHPRVSFLNGTG